MRLRKAWLPIALLIGLVLMAGTAPATATAPTLRLHAPAYPLPPAAVIEVDVVVEQALWLGDFEFVLHYDPALVEVLDITPAAAFGDDGPDCDPLARRCARGLGPVAGSGTARLGGYSYGAGKGLSGDQRIAVIRLRPTGVAGKTWLHLSDALLADIFARPATPATAGVVLTLGDGNLIYLPQIVRQGGGS